MLMNESKPFDSDDYIFELKLDGLRAVLYYDGKQVCVRNKRNDELIERYPELKNTKNFLNAPCVLDGEIICLTLGMPDFSKLQKRALLTNNFKIKLAMQSNPVQFVAYDILQVNDKVLLDTPLMERKQVLENVVVDSEIVTKSRFIEHNGVKFFELTKEQGLEGIVAKRKDSLYYMGKRTSVWLKIKALIDEDFLICGYKFNDEGKLKDVLLLRDLSKKQGASLVQIKSNGKVEKVKQKQDSKAEEKAIRHNQDKKTIIEYKGTHYQYMGSVAMGISKEDSEYILKFAKSHTVDLPLNISGANFIEPKIYCTVIYMLETDSGHLRQPVYKGIRQDRG